MKGFFVAIALAAGVAASIAGADDVANAVWSVASAVVAVELVVVTIVRLREGRVAVDVVALVALAGAIAMGEALAGAILALMVASGDALEHLGILVAADAEFPPADAHRNRSLRAHFLSSRLCSCRSS